MLPTTPAQVKRRRVFGKVFTPAVPLVRIPGSEKERGPPSSMKQRHRTSTVVVLAAMGVYALLLGIVCTRKYGLFAYDDFDLAAHTQSLWSILHGSPDCSVLGIPFLGNHMVLILYLIAPLYGLFPSPLLLLYIQAAALAAGAWAVYGLARRELSGNWSAGLAVIYLVYPPLIYMNLYEFHPIALATPLLLYAVYFYRERRFRIFLSFLLLASLCQENVLLIAAAFGLLALLHRRPWRWVLVPPACALPAFVLAAVIVMPRLNADRIQFHRLYSHLGDDVPTIVLAMVLHPMTAVSAVWHPLKLAFAGQLLGPLLFASLLDPLTFLPAAPVILQRILSARLSEARIIYHYQAELIPFVFAAAATGIARVIRIGRPIVKPALACALVLFTLASLATSGLPSLLVSSLRGNPALCARASRVDAALSRIPADATVVSSLPFLARLSRRSHLHSMHHVYQGVYTLSDHPYPLPVDVEYIAIDTMDRIAFLDIAPDATPRPGNLQDMIDDTWTTLENYEGFLLLGRSPLGTRMMPCRVVKEALLMNRNVVQGASFPYQIEGFSLGSTDTGSAMLLLYWRKTRDSQVDVDAVITIKARGRTLYTNRLAPGSRIWPPPTWPVGALMEDSHGIRIENGSVDAGDLSVEVRPFVLGSLRESG